MGKNRHQEEKANLESNSLIVHSKVFLKAFLKKIRKKENNNNNKKLVSKDIYWI